MYRLNELQRNVLIMPDEVIFHGPTDHTMDPRILQSSIIIAEERLIRPALGFDYYYALIDSKNKLITPSNISAQQTILDEANKKIGNSRKLEEGDVINAAEYLSAEDLTLWKQFLWKLTAECVIMVAYPEGYMKFTSSGVVHPNPPAGPMTSSGVVTPDLASMKWGIDKKMQDRIDPLIESMHLWLCKKKEVDSSAYPDYKKHCDCNSKGVAYLRKSDIVLGLYDDEDDHHYHRRRDCC